MSRRATEIGKMYLLYWNYTSIGVPDRRRQAQRPFQLAAVKI
jgi:hypothetical protein